jgi:isoaspartyl peptidase/L-asparaginase-like protein (Ntn-hydrolase superfamily)
MPEELWERSQAGVLRAANAGFSVFETGGSAVDAVVAAVSLVI